MYFGKFLHFDIQSTGQKSRCINTQQGPSQRFVLIRQSKISFILRHHCKMAIMLPWFMVQTILTDGSNWRQRRFCLQLATAMILPLSGLGDSDNFISNHRRFRLVFKIMVTVYAYFAEWLVTREI